MESLIRKTLDYCGYNEDDPTEENVIQCFLDYVNDGVFRNLTLEEASEMIQEGEITIEQICRNLIKRAG